MEDSKELLEKLDKLLLHLPDNSLPPLPDARTELFDSYHKVSELLPVRNETLTS